MRNLELSHEAEGGPGRARLSEHENDAILSTRVNAASAPVINEPQPGDILDERFKILRTINRGGMAWIYEALDLTTDKSVAVKSSAAALRVRCRFLFPL